MAEDTMRPKRPVVKTTGARQSDSVSRKLVRKKFNQQISAAQKAVSEAQQVYPDVEELDKKVESAKTSLAELMIVCQDLVEQLDLADIETIEIRKVRTGKKLPGSKA